MRITNQKDLLMVAEYLKKNSDTIQDYRLRGAFINVGYVLDKAIKEGDFDGEHDAYTLKVIKLPNLMDVAVSECCTTDCQRYAKGMCIFKDKLNCPNIRDYIYSDDDEFE